MKKVLAVILAAAGATGVALYAPETVQDILESKKKYDELKTSYDDLRTRYDAMQNRLAQLQENHKKEIEAAKKAYDHLGAEITQIQERHKAEIEQAKKTIADLDIDLEAARRGVAQWKTEAEKYKEAVQRILNEPGQPK